METVDGLIKRFNTSRRTIYKHLHKLYVKNDNLIKHTYTKKGRRYFDDVLVNALGKSLNYRNNNKEPYRKANYLQFTSLQSRIHDLKNKLDNKNDKINDQKQVIKHSYTIQDSQDHSIRKLEKLLDQQQELSLADKKDKKDLQDQVKQLKRLNGPKSNTQPANINNSNKNTKHGFIWHLFH